MSIWNHLLCKPMMNFLHKKCRNVDYPYIKSSIYRVAVEDENVKWSKVVGDYHPPDYTASEVIGKPWADPEVNAETKFLWNSVDGKVNRKSFICDYFFDPKMRPMNPMGRTGLAGRGILGKWGPNHAADPLVTRYDKDGQLEFVAIKRGDTGEWAIPGGMVDAGEQVSETLKREFSEEAMHGVVDQHRIEDLWKNGKELYRGYVDDPRNTDNAWMETVVVNFHDENGLLTDITLQAGDDAKELEWIRVDTNRPLYASHEHFIHLLKQSRPLVK